MKLGLREVYNILLELDRKGSIKSLDHEAISEDMGRAERDIEYSNQKILRCTEEIIELIQANKRNLIIQRIIEIRVEAMNISTEYENLVEEIDKLIKGSDVLKC
jgi:hypothetical protein